MRTLREVAGYALGAFLAAVPGCALLSWLGVEWP